MVRERLPFTDHFCLVEYHDFPLNRTVALPTNTAAPDVDDSVVPAKGNQDYIYDPESYRKK